VTIVEDLYVMFGQIISTILRNTHWVDVTLEGNFISTFK